MAMSKALNDHAITDDNAMEKEGVPDAFPADILPKILQTAHSLKKQLPKRTLNVNL